MKIHLEYRNPTHSHFDIAIFINGALAGEITLRQGEIITFQDIILHGINPKLDKLLKDAGIPRHECWVTNLIKYEVIPGPAPFLTRCRSLDLELDQCLEELQKEINQVKPNCILALGKTALWGLTGKKNIKNYRGSILIGMGRKVVGTYHPAHLLYYQAAEFKGYWNRLVMIHDMKRAWSQAQFSELILPNS